MCAGIILESAVRKLCERQGLIPENGNWISLAKLIDDLRVNEVFNEHQVTALKAWKDIRNDVAHGKFDSFTRNDVERMIDGVKRFVDEYL